MIHPMVNPIGLATNRAVAPVISARTNAPMSIHSPPSSWFRPKSISPKNAMTNASQIKTVEVKRTWMERCFFCCPGRQARCDFVSRSGRHGSRPGVSASSGFIVFLLICLIGEEVAEIVVTFHFDAGVSTCSLGPEEVADLSDQSDRPRDQHPGSPGAGHQGTSCFLDSCFHFANAADDPTDGADHGLGGEDLVFVPSGVQGNFGELFRADGSK